MASHSTDANFGYRISTGHQGGGPRRGRCKQTAVRARSLHRDRRTRRICRESNCIAGATGTMPGKIDAAIRGSLALIALTASGCTRFERRPQDPQPTATAYESPTPIVVEEKPTATPSPAIEETPTATPSPETTARPSPLVVSYRDLASCHLVFDENGVLVPGPDCYHEPEGTVPQDEHALEDFLDQPLPGSLNLRVSNPGGAVRLYPIPGQAGVGTYGEDQYILCASRATFGDYVCKAKAVFGDDEAEIHIDTFFYRAAEPTETPGASTPPTQGPPPDPRGTPTPLG